MQYLCVEFSKGDDPHPWHSDHPFTVEGVVSGEDFQLVPRNLRGCSRAPPCICTFVCLLLPEQIRLELLSTTFKRNDYNRHNDQG